jgi:hypothetical protein
MQNRPEKETQPPPLTPEESHDLRAEPALRAVRWSIFAPLLTRDFSPSFSMLSASFLNASGIMSPNPPTPD